MYLLQPINGMKYMGIPFVFIPLKNSRFVFSSYKTAVTLIAELK